MNDVINSKFVRKKPYNKDRVKVNCDEQIFLHIGEKYRSPLKKKLIGSVITAVQILRRNQVEEVVCRYIIGIGYQRITDQRI